jgi:ABC-2 type transport system ATP-binding protein
VLLATHDMAEAEKLADRAAILLRGKIAALGSPRQLTATGRRKTRISVATENALLKKPAAVFPDASFEGEAEGYAMFISDNPGRTVSAILAWLEQNNDPLIDLRVERPSLEERFLELTGGSK